jgi:hypothetical protein
MHHTVKFTEARDSLLRVHTSIGLHGLAINVRG